MKSIIRVKNVSKTYQIGGLDAGYATFREMVAGALTKPFRRRGSARNGETLWALKDLNFEVMPGEVVGLIGHNGAGKSTLLKILSKITVPTIGRTEVYGRIGSLLEVGTGFHPDLTGRENIFLNGTVLGIKRAEIARRFDEIVDFSGVEKFIDTPVKWYSSGMYLRLAFAVAVNLESEVLIMDEVLAVGDVGFQQKCLDKMHEIRNQGRTILFVSHSMPAVTRLCDRAILLEHGKVLQDGPAHRVVNDYLGSNWKITSEREWAEGLDAPGNDFVKLMKVRSVTGSGMPAESHSITDAVGIELVFDVLQPGQLLLPRVEVITEEGISVFASHDTSSQWVRIPREVGRHTSTVWIPGNFLTAGNFLVHVSVVTHVPSTSVHVHEHNVITFQVVDKGGDGTARGDYLGPIPGVVRPVFTWTNDFSATPTNNDLIPSDRALVKSI